MTTQVTSIHISDDECDYGSTASTVSACDACESHQNSANLSSSLRRTAAKNLATMAATSSPNGRNLKTIVVVDPWSTGTRLCREVKAQGFELIIVWLSFQRSTQLSLLATHNLMYGPNLGSDASAEDKAAEQQRFVAVVTALKDIRSSGGYDIRAIVPGSETGVLVAEKLAFTMGFQVNPQQSSRARRDKYAMGEMLRRKGVRAVKQKLCFEWSQAEQFIKEWNPSPFKVIVKPNQGAGSDDVFLCKDVAQVQKAFAKINNNMNSLGEKNEGVLVQEFLDGIEYVVDSVTKDGKHEIVAVWEYDKREANGRFNVYFGNFPLALKDGECSELVKKLKEYAYAMLDALEFVNGPSHAEIKMTSTGPCLVEVGARCHGGNATWLEVAQNFYGWNQINKVIEKLGNGTCDSCEQDCAKPCVKPLNVVSESDGGARKFGVVCDFVAYEEGPIESVPGEAFVLGLESYFSLDLYKKAGDSLVITVDCNTTPGQAILIHPDEAVVRRDYNNLHALLALKDGFFKLKRQ